MGLMHPHLSQPAPQAICDPAAEAEYWTRQVAACALMEDISASIGQPVDLVWQALCTVPDNMLSLLDSPQGWTALAGYVAVELGMSAPDYLPAVH